MVNPGPENASFTVMLAEHRQQTQVSPEVVERTLDVARFAVRLRGGYLTDCTLRNPRDDKAVSLFKTKDDLTTPEPHAGHITCFIEGYDMEDERGFPRWVDYRLGPNCNVDTAIAPLQADVGDGPFSLRKIVQLRNEGSRLSSHAILANRTAEPKVVGLGEHFCFDLPSKRLRGLSIGDVWIGHCRKGKEVERRLESGKPHFFAGYHGMVLIDFPGGRRLTLTSNAATGRNDRESRMAIPPERIGMVIRHEPNSGTLCLEPTLRRYENEYGTLGGGRTLAPDFVVALRTSIDLLK